MISILPYTLFWHSVLNQPDELCKAIYDVEVTAKEWQRQKDILNSPEKPQST
jgi:DNA adenine methylase